MKITYKNIGPVKLFEIDLNSDLSFIFGKNNIGKSYVITLTYLILKHLLSPDIRNIFAHRPTSFRMFDVEIIDKENSLLLRNKLSNHDQDVNIKEDVHKIFKQLLKIFFLDKLESSLITSFGDMEMLFNRLTPDDHPKILIDLDDYSIEIGVENNSMVIVNIIDSKEIIEPTPFFSNAFFSFQKKKHEIH